MPGDSGEIEVKYKTTSLNSFRKKITVSSNAYRPSIILTIKGIVVDSSNTNVLNNRTKSILEK